jgi:CRISPR-associated protein Cas5d
MLTQGGLMANQRSPEFRVRAFGELACFTRPEMKVERVSYEVMTPSAARGILEAILWKPAIRWIVRAIEVHAPIVFTSFKRNEVNTRARIPSAGQTAGTDPFEPYFADEDRAQRNTLALRDVDYVIRAAFVMTKLAGPDDNLTKFVEMFRRRLEKGQCHHMPYLGCREFAASVEPALPDRAPPALSKPLGWMLHDMDFGPPIRPRFFAAKIENGVVYVPPFDSSAPSSVLAPGGAA